MIVGLQHSACCYPVTPWPPWTFPPESPCQPGPTFCQLIARRTAVTLPTYIHICSYGSNHRIMPEAHAAFDVTWLPNPFKHPSLKDLSGLDGPVQQYLLDHEDTEAWLHGVLLTLRPHIRRSERLDGPSAVYVAVGCRGGHDRSVGIAEILAGRLRQQSEYPVSVSTAHLDLHRRGGR
ncbi:RapZ C-terminal domain-containing protein [Amycolatopsis arida]|uniref:RapZ C-terminal domain-containing protein n=1 Tax=Amycolatopsis arida TaxID=587909 RepID=UPI003C7B9669